MASEIGGGQRGSEVLACILCVSRGLSHTNLGRNVAPAGRSIWRALQQTGVDVVAALPLQLQAHAVGVEGQHVAVAVAQLVRARQRRMVCAATRAPPQPVVFLIHILQAQISATLQDLGSVKDDCTAHSEEDNPPTKLSAGQAVMRCRTAEGHLALPRC